TQIERRIIMGDKQRRDYGSGSISQRKDGTWTARMIIGTNEAGKPRIKAFYGKSEREVKKKMKEFEKELHKNDGTVVQKNTVEAYMRDWLWVTSGGSGIGSQLYLTI
ncbi:MAG: hypothetical protein PUD80_04890, partial [Firmicutes bacterium]|nr:hypothetical protein [Bacillota bacterium]